MGYSQIGPKQSPEIALINAKILALAGELVKMQNEEADVETNMAGMVQELQENEEVTTWFMQKQVQMDQAIETFDKISTIINTVNSGIDTLQDWMLTEEKEVDEGADAIGAFIPVIGSEIEAFIKMFSDGVALVTDVTNDIQDAAKFIGNLTAKASNVLTLIQSVTNFMTSLPGMFSKLTEEHEEDVEALSETNFLTQKLTLEIGTMYTNWATEINGTPSRQRYRHAWLYWRPIGSSTISRSIYNYLKTNVSEMSLAELRASNLMLGHAFVVGEWFVSHGTKRMLVFSVGSVKTLKQYASDLIRGQLLGKKIKRLMLQDPLIQWEDITLTRETATSPWTVRRVVDQDGNDVNAEHRIRIAGDVVAQGPIGTCFPRARTYLNCMRHGLQRDGVGYSILGPNCQTQSESFYDFLVTGLKPKDQVIWTSPTVAEQYNWWTDKCSAQFLKAVGDCTPHNHGVEGVDEFTSVGLPQLPTIVGDDYHDSLIPTSTTGPGPFDWLHGLGTTIVSKGLDQVLADAQIAADAGLEEWDGLSDTILEAAGDVPTRKPMKPDTDSFVDEVADWSENNEGEFSSLLYDA
jgi:hypothetical protein